MVKKFKLNEENVPVVIDDGTDLGEIVYSSGGDRKAPRTEIVGYEFSHRGSNISQPEVFVEDYKESIRTFWKGDLTELYNQILNSAYSKN